MVIMADCPPGTLGWESHPAADEDQHLVARFARGDRSAFDRIVAIHHDRIARLAYRLLGWADDADDVVQEVFLAAMRALPKFRGQASLATWLTTITVNKCRTFRHRRRLRLKWLVGARARRRETPAEPADRQPGDRETFDRVRQAIRALPARYREVVVLRYLEQMPTEAISRILGISRNSVDVRLHRARARLKSQLAALVED